MDCIDGIVTFVFTFVFTLGLCAMGGGVWMGDGVTDMSTGFIDDLSWMRCDSAITSRSRSAGATEVRASSD